MVNKSRFFEDSALYQEHFLGRDIPYPKLAIIETSSLCNLKCPMCPRTINQSPSGETFRNMKFELVERLAPLYPRLDEVVLSWIGEPLINKKLGQMIRFIKKFGPKVHVTTNAVLLTENRIHELIDSGLDSIAVSIDAPDPERFAQIRVGTDLETVKSNVKLFNQIKKERGVDHPSLGIAFVAMAENISGLPDMVPLTRELGTSTLSIDLIDDFTLPDVFQLESSKTTGPQQEARASLKKCIETAEREDVKLVFPSLRLFHELDEWPEGEQKIEDLFFRMDYTPEETSSVGLRKGCGVPWAHVVIGHDGNVHPCCVSGTVLGNVYEQEFDDVWYGARYSEFRRKLKSSDPPEECWNCRRTIWNGSRRTEKPADSIVVGGDEALGMGWGPVADDLRGRTFRGLDREATFFLGYSGQEVLSLELAPAEWINMEGEVRVNDRPVRRFKLFPGWHRLFVALPDIEGESIKVTLVTHSRKGQLIFHRAELRDRDLNLFEERTKNFFWRHYNRFRVAFSRYSL